MLEGVDRQQKVQQGHGRLVGQIASVLPAQGIVPLGDWPQCKTIGRIHSLRRRRQRVGAGAVLLHRLARALTAEQLAVSGHAFDFLDHIFRPRVVKNGKRNNMFVSFTPAVSNKALTAMWAPTRKLSYRNRTELSLADISRLHNPILRGCLAYYGRFYRSAMYPVFRHFNKMLVAWAMRKYRRLKGHKIRACRFLQQLSEKKPHFSVHWQKGMAGAFA